MLQQTQVKTVIPYWERWMTAFPDVRALAAAPEATVLKLWEGLGYYSRARNLQKAARQICVERGGVFPAVFEEALDLPGVGRYTAGAICSIAFGLPAAILDGNVARVLSRLFAVGGDLKSAATQKRLWDLSLSLVQAASDCSSLNQGLMELGATVCLPRSPLCSACPLESQCEARAKNQVDRYPRKKEAEPMRERHFVAVLLQRDGMVLIRQRSPHGVNAGLWEFPNFELENGEMASERVAGFGALRWARTIKHTITRNRITLEAYAGAPRGSAAALERSLGGQWAPVNRLHDFAFSSAHARLRTWLQAHLPSEDGTHGSRGRLT